MRTCETHSGPLHAVTTATARTVARSDTAGAIMLFSDTAIIGVCGVIMAWAVAFVVWFCGKEPSPD